MYTSTVSLTSALDGGERVVSATAQTFYSWERDQAEWAPGLAKIGAEKLASSGI